MQKRHKDLLRTLVRELRHKLVGSNSPIDGTITRGNLDRELERLGIAPDGTIKPIDSLTQPLYPSETLYPSPTLYPSAPNEYHAHEHYAHRVAADQLAPLPLSQRPAVRTEIIEDAAYTWINRLLALRAMEVRNLIDNTLRGEEAYGGISEKLFLVRDHATQTGTRRRRRLVDRHRRGMQRTGQIPARPVQAQRYHSSIAPQFKHPAPMHNADRRRPARLYHRGIRRCI